MHKVDSADNVANEFSDGSPPLTPATVLASKWLNTIQRELVNVVLTKAGIALSDADDTQLGQALDVLYASTPAWNAATLLTPWTTLSSTPSYRFEASTKRVFLKGGLTATISSSSDWDFWEVPPSYAPPHDLYLPAVAYDGTYKNAVLHIGLGSPNYMELFTVNGAAPVNSTAYDLYLDGVSWAID